MADENERSNIRRCGQIGDGDDDELSMVDVLNEQARLQADADAVLGGSDEHNCTYPEGYLNRQAVYACKTCTPDGLAGICLACSYACHEGHELYELYTKRNFRCDCGNEKFGTKIGMCKLYAGKMEPNTKNRYSHNFKGLYCSCARPYPDPEDTTDDEMIQCIMCEDWHHGRHLNTAVPESEFNEMICPACMTKHSFLWAYQVGSELTPVTKEENGVTEESADVNIDSTESQASVECSNDGTKAMSAASTSGSISIGVKRERAEEDTVKTNECSSPKKVKKDIGTSEVKAEGNESNSEETCLLKALQWRLLEHSEKATFWLDGWRKKLCHCKECMEMYKDKDIEFLVDESDTVQAYEDKGRNANVSMEETEASALAGMNRVQQIEVVRGFMDMKTQLNEFLQDFARDGKVVTESDIQEFFQRMQRKRRGQIGVPQPFCR